MQTDTLVVSRRGRQWGISAEGEVLLIAPTKQQATHLANAAAKVLRGRGGSATVVIAQEPRSFVANED
ncbi:MAG TPA: hypothetical protein VL358_07195 [Caulobacteraceae bacterium]|jgi:hypothetical protein|nr:hypothetical protein [Caulobacteraceae bacterium]